MAKFQMRTSTSSFAWMANSRTIWQASSTTCTIWFSCSTASLHYRFNFSMLMCWSLITCRSVTLPSLKFCGDSVLQKMEHLLRDCSHLNLTPFKLLTIGLSASFSAMSAPSGSTIVLVILAHNISSATEVPTLRLLDNVPAYGVHTCNSCICVQRSPNINWCRYSNCWRESKVTSPTISLISCKSPSVMVIGSKYVFEDIVFFRILTFSRGCRCLSWVDIVYGFVPHCYVFLFQAR